MNREERKTLCKKEFTNCEIVKENKQLQDKLKKIEEYIKEKLIYIDNAEDQRIILEIIKGEI